MNLSRLTADLTTRYYNKNIVGKSGQISYADDNGRFNVDLTNKGTMVEVSPYMDNSENYVPGDPVLVFMVNGHYDTSVIMGVGNRNSV